MGDEKPVMSGPNATRIKIKDGCWVAQSRYLDVTVVLLTALAKAGYEVVLATPAVDPESDAVTHFGEDDAKGWQ